jgi:hypothetical protein
MPWLVGISSTSPTPRSGCMASLDMQLLLGASPTRPVSKESELAGRIVLLLAIMNAGW